MNRTGLAVALTVAVVVGVLFALYPQLDLDLAGLFFNRQANAFSVGLQTWVLRSRDAARYFIALLVAPAVVVIVGKVFMPRRHFPMGIRAAVFLVLTLAIGPGVVANLIFKDHWGRSRPIDVTEFGGTDRFTAWWDPRGECPNNCSFIAGEPSGAFWTLAPASFAPPQWRLAAYGAALAFGAAVGVLRMIGGGHFFTDIVFAGVFMFLVIWASHGIIFRWRSLRQTEKTKGPDRPEAP